ncbi:hypothetical protein GBAG_0885 [Buttiauxella agrestis ATCC 33320]|uniref:Uncharacterized protein n=1 Tax=Buttiauxella agrestis ATCC 33320 TaxID=1006004 RepID=A0A085GIA1_9ENTR|nr:hypothetical protein GBAG_0885 [Buttiauxella agrestis ATCC 33320]
MQFNISGYFPCHALINNRYPLSDIYLHHIFKALCEAV